MLVALEAFNFSNICSTLFRGMLSTAACVACFFFGLCCARRNDSGSHEDMLKWSSVDNSIEQVGQKTTRKQKQKKQTAPTTNPNQQNLTNL